MKYKYNKYTLIVDKYNYHNDTLSITPNIIIN
jgi:hypothetical protein